MEVWEARRIDKILDAGRTHPLVVECVGPQPESTNRRSFIVKALALPEIKEASLGFELIGNLLARQLGVDTPEPVLVRLSLPSRRPVELYSKDILTLPAEAQHFCRDMAQAASSCRRSSQHSPVTLT